MLLAGSLNQLWSLIRSQQIIILLPLFNVHLPANSAIVFGMLMQIAAFDPYETEPLWNELLRTPATGPLKETFGVIGLESTLFLNNIGSQFFIILLISFMYLMYMLLIVFKQFSSSLTKVMNKAKRFMFWSIPIRYTSESFLIILLCAAINLERPDVSSFGLALNTNLSITFVGICILAIPFVWYFFY